MFLPAEDRWDEAVAGGLSAVDELVYRARLIGTDKALTRESGGNFSAKTTVLDHRGRAIQALWMSAWGCDGASCSATDFPALRLDDLRAVRRSGPMSEAEMVEYLLASGLRGEQPRPGIETLTHAFIDAAHVDHTHPDSVITLTAIPDGRELAKKVFGDEAFWFDYRQFDVDVAREFADEIFANPNCRFVLMANHGLLTWADTGRECYLNTLEAVVRSAEAVAQVTYRPVDLGGRVVPPREDSRALLAEVLPVLRGLTGPVLQMDRGRLAEAFASSRRGPRLSLNGPACPDSLVTAGFRPMIADLSGPEPAGRVRAAVDAFRREYRMYYDRHAYDRHVSDRTRAMPRRPDTPGIVVLPGVGVVAAGTDAVGAQRKLEHFGQTMTVIRAADAAGGYETLSEAQGFADEYWPMMTHKPGPGKPGGKLAGKVVLVTDDSALGGTIGYWLAGEGAHVALATTDPDKAKTISQSVCDGRVIQVSPAGGPDEVVREAVLAFGGFDVVVGIVPHAVDATGLARAALPVFEKQGGDGAILVTGQGAARVVTELSGVFTGHPVSVNGISGIPSAEAVSEAVTLIARAPFTGNVLSAQSKRRTL